MRMCCTQPVWMPLLYVHNSLQWSGVEQADPSAIQLLSFFKFSIRLLLALLPIAVLILLPVHYKFTGKNGIPGWDGSEPLDDKDQLMLDPSYLSMYVVFGYIFSGLTIYLLVRQTDNVIRTRQKYLGSQTSTTDRTIRLSGIPPEMRSEESIRDFMQGLHVGKVQSVTMCRDWSALELLIEKRMKIIRHLERAWTKHVGYKRVKLDESQLPLVQHRRRRGASLLSEDDTERMQLLSDNGRTHTRDDANARPTIRLWYGPLKLRYRTVDEIDYYEEKLRRIDEAIKHARKLVYPPTELAFVTMESIAASQMVIQAILDPHPMLLLARLAPAPADVVWKNTYVPRSRRMMQSWSVTILIGFLTVFWSVLLVPFASLLELKTIEKVFPQFADLLARHPVLMSLVQTGLPTLGLSLMTVIVPYLYNCTYALLPGRWTLLTDMQGYRICKE